jgi:LPS export ABC transporter protein LptC
MSKVQRLLNFLVSYGPIFSMLVLALFSFALVKNSAKIQHSSTPNSQSDSYQNYYLQQFFTSEFEPLGRVKKYIKGTSALHLDQSKQLLVANLNFSIKNQQIRYDGGANSALIDDAGGTVRLNEKVKIMTSTLQSNRP